MKRKLLCLVMAFAVILGISACDKGNSSQLMQLNKIGDQDITFMDDKYIVSDGADAYDFYSYMEKKDPEKTIKEYPNTQYQEICAIKCDWSQIASVSWDRNRMYCIPNYESNKDEAETTLVLSYYTTLSLGEFYKDPEYSDVNHMEDYLQVQRDEAMQRGENSVYDDEGTFEPKGGSIQKTNINDHEINYIVTEYGHFGNYMIQIDTYEQRSEDSAFCVSIQSEWDSDGHTVDYEKSIEDVYSKLSFTKEFDKVTEGSVAAKKTILSPSGEWQCKEEFPEYDTVNLGRSDMMVSTEDADITFEFLPYTEEEAVDYTLDISDYERESNKYYVLSDEMQPIKYKGQDFLTAKKIYDTKDYDLGFKECYFVTTFEDSVFKITYSEVETESVKGEDLDANDILDDIMKNIKLERTSSEKSGKSGKNIEKQISKCWSGVYGEDEYAFFVNEDKSYAGYVRKSPGEFPQVYVGDLTGEEKKISAGGRSYDANEYTIKDENKGSVTVVAFEMSGKIWLHDELNDCLFSLDPSTAEAFTKYLN